MQISNPSAAGLSFEALVGDVLEAHSTANVTSTATVYTKVKAIRVGRRGNYRVVFDFKKGGVGGVGYARIYVNDSPAGTEIVDDTDGVELDTYSEDFLGLSAGDEIQIWVYKEGSAQDTQVENFFIQSVESPFNEAVLE